VFSQQRSASAEKEGVLEPVHSPQSDLGSPCCYVIRLAAIFGIWQGYGMGREHRLASLFALDTISLMKPTWFNHPIRLFFRKRRLERFPPTMPTSLGPFGEGIRMRGFTSVHRIHCVAKRERAGGPGPDWIGIGLVPILACHTSSDQCSPFSLLLFPLSLLPVLCV
jgi:hypothetical protein